MKNFATNNDVWALIPARSGSKGIKQKNLQKIMNYSLLSYAVKAAERSKYIERTFVSTNSKKIKREAIKFAAEVPFLRSKKNSSDTATDYEVILEFLKKIIKIEKILPKYIIYLLPTTPFRDPKVLDTAIIKFKKLKKYDSLISVHEMDEPIHKKFFIKDNKLKPVFSNLSLDDANKPRQIYPKSYTYNGYLYVVKTKNILKKISLGTQCFPFLTSKTIDIDNKFNLSFARCAAKYLYKLSPKKINRKKYV